MVVLVVLSTTGCGCPPVAAPWRGGTPRWVIKRNLGDRYLWKRAQVTWGRGRVAEFSMLFLGFFRALGALSLALTECIKIGDLFVLRDGAGGGKAALSFSVARRGLSYRPHLAAGACLASPSGALGLEDFVVPPPPPRRAWPANFCEETLAEPLAAAPAAPPPAGGPLPVAAHHTATAVDQLELEGCKHNS